MAAPSPANQDVEAGRRCAACRHLWAQHDDIAARFCAATIVGSYSRGCVCVAGETAAAPAG